MAWCPVGDEVDQGLFDALSEFFAHLLQRGEDLAAEFGIPAFCLKAIHRLDTSVTLKELGKRMHCDPSFVTVIADELEQRGLARREPNAVDRRIKNLVLTPEGLELKARLETALLREMPWAQALDLADQKSLLSMIRRMNDALSLASAPLAGSEETGEVSDTLIAASGPTAGRRSDPSPGFN
jgi:DNA-binding MarR family transcriptional regulator